MPHFTHPSVDEYLQAIFELESEGGRVIQARLAARLEVSAPSVSEMVRRLRTDGYLQTSSDPTLELTEKGRAWAVAIVRRHHLAERLLTDLLGLPWYRAHTEACRWEHVISPEVEELMVARLGNPATCPHGNPIPGAGAPVLHLVPLSDTGVGDVFRLERVSEELELDHDALFYLDGHGFVPGVRGTVSVVAPDHTRLIALENTSLAVGPSLASGLFVTLTSA
jgi:DtxR family Mn-dependent transcriptional regulator